MAEATCSFPGCPKRPTGRGLCNTHYQRWYRNGDPAIAFAPQGGTLPERLWRRVEKTSESDDACWLWKGGRSTTGYGFLKFEHKSYSVHRLSFELAYGPVPDGLFVCHRCDVRNCVRPSHLFAGSALENSQDRDRKGRGARGESIANSRITEDVVRAVRAEHASGILSYPEVAARFGLTASHVGQIVRRICWKHVA